MSVLIFQHFDMHRQVIFIHVSMFIHDLDLHLLQLFVSVGHNNWAVLNYVYVTVMYCCTDLLVLFLSVLLLVFSYIFDA